MAKTNLASMSVDALLKLRDDIGDVLGRKASELKQQLSRLAGGGSPAKEKTTRRKGSSRKGSKVAPKYRGPGGETWSGRGLKPRWLTAAVKDGKKVDDFLIDKSSAAKKVRRKKKKAR
jgi:DNA-binding protein H-NS